MRLSCDHLATYISQSEPRESLGCTGKHPVASQVNEERSPQGRVVIELGRLGARLEDGLATGQPIANVRVIS